MKTLAYFLLAALSAYAGPVLTVTGPQGNVKAGSTVQLTVSISGAAGTNTAGLQALITVPGTNATCTAAAAATTAAKQVDCNNTPNGLLFLVDGINDNVLADGAIVNVTVTIPTATPSGTFSSVLSAPVVASLQGDSVPVTAGAPFGFGIISACDINADGKTDSTDVNLAKGQILTGNGGVPDLSGDGAFNIIDLQRVINAAKGGTCRVN